MRTIWKFTLKVLDFQGVMMPKGATILSVQPQHDTICMWALCDAGAEKEVRNFSIHDTGELVSSEDHKHFIGTVQQFGGSSVRHVFELQENIMEG